MKVFFAFLKLIRWPNLLFIALTQLLFRECIYASQLQEDEPGLPSKYFYLLISASVLIAAAGYIINDYFDLRIDAINKPQKVIVDRVIKRRVAILMHWLLSAAGLGISIYISYHTATWLLSFINFFCILLLYFYSIIFKRKNLVGNIIISALTAWVIIAVYFLVTPTLFGSGFDMIGFNSRKFFKLMMLYAGFAFIVSLVREVIKDLEDMDGDRQYGCTTMPIAWGVPAAKIFTAVWISVCILAVLAVQLYAMQSGWWPVVIYSLIFIVVPLLIVLYRLRSAAVPSQYNTLSNYLKAIMLAGILSMLFIKFAA